MNEVNKILQGLYQGGTQVAGGMFDRAERKDAQSQFTEYKTGLMSTYQQLMAQNQRLLSGVETPEGDLQQGNSSLNQQPIVDPMQEYEKLMGLQSNLAGNKYGEPLVKQAESMYNQLLGKDNAPNYEIREVNGQLVRYDKTNPNKFEVVYGDKKPEKTVYNQKFFESQTAETIKDLTPDQIKEGYFYLPKELQEQLYSNPEIRDYVDNVQNQGDYSKTKTGGLKRGGRIGSKNPPISFGLKKDDNKFSKLDEFNERIRGGEQLTEGEMENYNTLRLGLGQKYDLNDTQLASVIDRINEATTVKEKNQILESLDKGDYYEDKGTNQEQIDYDRNRINEWKTALNDAYSAGDGSYDGYKQSFLQELEDFYNRGSITKKEYSDLRKSYY